MKMLRELTKKEFKQFKKLFQVLTVLLAIYYIFFSYTLLSQILVLSGCILSFSCFMLFKQHEVYDNKYKKDE